MTGTHGSHLPSSDKNTSYDKPVQFETHVTSEESTNASEKSMAETKAKEKGHADVEKHEVTEHSLSAAPKPKLPKLVLPRFKGDITMFQSYWDGY